MGVAEVMAAYRRVCCSVNLRADCLEISSWRPTVDFEYERIFTFYLTSADPKVTEVEILTIFFSVSNSLQWTGSSNGPVRALGL